MKKERREFTVETKTFGKVKIKELSILDVLTMNNLREEEQLSFAIEKCLVEPKITQKEILELPVSAIPDLTKIVQLASGQDSEDE
jgi:hypothetical protein